MGDYRIVQQMQACATWGKAVVSKEFLLLIGIAFLIAAPLAYYYMHDWLQDFVYRVDISWWILALSGLITVVVALVTISFKAVKAAGTSDANLNISIKGKRSTAPKKPFNSSITVNAGIGL